VVGVKWRVLIRVGMNDVTAPAEVFVVIIILEGGGGG